MKFKVGDTVRVKSREWYGANKNRDGDVERGGSLYYFVDGMAAFCGELLEIVDFSEDTYRLEGNEFVWHDWMFEDSMVEGATIEGDIIFMIRLDSGKQIFTSANSISEVVEKVKAQGAVSYEVLGYKTELQKTLKGLL